MQVTLDGTSNKNKKPVHSYDHPDIENALNTYIRARIPFMVGFLIQGGCNLENCFKATGRACD